MDRTNAAARELLESMFQKAVNAAHPKSALPPHLPEPPSRGRLVILAAGKAAGSMTQIAEQRYAELPQNRIAGLGITRHGYGRPTTRIPVIEAGHPVPDKIGVSGTKRVLALADAVDANDLVLVLLSGGASANWIAPAPGLALEEKQAVTRALLKSGANIGEMNAVRKHLSRIKGGRLTKRAHPAKVVTLAISDVPGDDPAVIGSGPTVPDPTTLADAREIVSRYRLKLPDAITRALHDPGNETPKPGDHIFSGSDYRIVARPADALRAAAECAGAAGYECIMLGDRLQGEARDVAAEHARLALEARAQNRRAAILSGGELTVTLRGNGRGGPNQEYALALAIHLDGAPGIAALAADTDGTDGGGGRSVDPAGAFVDPTTRERARRAGL
ncbi:MAG: glycerate kinase, partial [Xanthobacteraceae bacterium]